MRPFTKDSALIFDFIYWIDQDKEHAREKIANELNKLIGVK